MTAQVHPLAAAATVPTAPAPDTPAPSLEDLLQHSRDLIAESADQVRDIGELAFMELDLAVAASKWLLVAVLLFAVSILLLFTFTMAALAIFLIHTVTPAAVLLLCGLCNAVFACLLFFWVKSLSRKLKFRNLRQQLSRKESASHV